MMICVNKAQALSLMRIIAEQPDLQFLLVEDDDPEVQGHVEVRVIRTTGERKCYCLTITGDFLGD